ncbi:MAG: hypothetical protein EOM59_06720 [Clostridia bacterium]|nr:hypothetical protein [Clostridia bacterium]
MKAIRRKLKSKNGATLVMALIYLLLCVTLGSIILSSGSTAMGQIFHLRDQEQSYLNVRSAAELIKSEMQGTAFVEKYITINHTEVCDMNEASPQTMITYPLNVLTDQLQAIYGDSSAESVFIIKAPSLNLEDVSVTVSMDENDALKFILTEQGDSLYTLTLIMQAEVSNSYETEVLTHEFESPSGSGNYVLCTRTYSCSTTTSAFDLGLIYKGVR